MCIDTENVHVVDKLSNVIDISPTISDENVPCGGFSFVPIKISSIISTLDGEFICLVLALLLYEGKCVTPFCCCILFKHRVKRIKRALTDVIYFTNALIQTVVIRKKYG